MERENYYVLLELPIDPPTLDPGQIRAAINRKKQEWMRWQDVPGKRTQALAYLSALPEIEQVMFTSATRKAEAREAKAILAEKLRRFEAELRILEGKGYLLPREVSAIAAKYKAFGVDQQKVRHMSKAPISENPPTPESEEAPGDVIDRVTAKTIDRNLAVIGKSDLYTFLGEPRYSSIKKLRESADSCRRSASGGKSAQSAATQELAGICLRLFENFNTKQQYDRYLKISAFPGLAEMIDEEFTRQRHISPEVMLRLINFGVQTYGMGVLDAEDYIKRYCAAYRIPIGAEQPLIPCPACKERVARESVVCSFCAQPLKGDCPGCGTPFDEGPAACSSCGFLICDMVKALSYMEAAQSALFDGNWSVAHHNLQFVEKYWPGHPELAQMLKHSAKLEERYAYYMDQISDCISKNQYYSALALIEEAEQKHIRPPSATARQVRQVVDDLEQQLSVITAAETLNVETLMQLASSITDSMELTRLLSSHPPKAPASLRASVAGRQISLGWSDVGMPGATTYLLVRKQGAAPFTPFDGDILYEGLACSFLDHSANPLTDYYYRIFTRRGTIYSKDGASFGPVMMIPELENLRILPADQGAQISWQFNPEIREVLIWRKLGGERPDAPGDGILLETNRIDGFMDTRIKNDVDYWYYLVAVYTVDGKLVQSKGICEMITPHRILAPVDRLTIAKSEYGENEFVVNWNNTEIKDLILLASPRKPLFKTGDVFPVQELLSSYRNLSLHARTADSGRFRYAFTGGAYIFAATLFGKFAAVGVPVFLTNLRDVEQLTAELSDGDLILNMRWPAGLGEIAIAWKNDTYPTSLDELGINAVFFTREQYDYNGGVVLRDIPDGIYYFKVYAVYPSPGGQKGISNGVELTFRNQPRHEIFYRFSYKRKLFGKRADLSVILSGPKTFNLPVVLVVRQQDRLPLSRTDGDTMFEIRQEPRVHGEVIFQYQIDPLPPGAHLRLFLADDKQYRTFRLLPGSELKIT